MIQGDSFTFFGAENISSLNATEVVQLGLMKLIHEERRNINSCRFILPTEKSHASRNPPQSTHANVDFINSGMKIVVLCEK